MSLSQQKKKMNLESWYITIRILGCICMIYIYRLSSTVTNVLSAPWDLWNPPEWGMSLPRGRRTFPPWLWFATITSTSECSICKNPPVFGETPVTLWWCLRRGINQRHCSLRRLLSNSRETQRPTNMLTNHVGRQPSPCGILEHSMAAGPGKGDLSLFRRMSGTLLPSFQYWECCSVLLTTEPGLDYEGD